MTTKRKRERYMTVLGGYKLDMENHGHLVRESMPERLAGKDYGADPIGDGTFRMVPSGDVVTFEERNRRLAHYDIV
jgi:hypothetical protein